MTSETLTSIHELDSRVTDGIQVRLLWSAHENRLWVAVLDFRRSGSFVVEVAAGESPRDVFYHPYAYAALRGGPAGSAVDATQALRLAA